MLEIKYSNKFDKLIQSELLRLNIKTGNSIDDGDFITLEVEKYPSKSELLNNKTDWESL